MALILLISGLSLQAQEHTFDGVVRDKITQKGIPNVNITFPGSTIGCITGPEGGFSFVLDTLPVNMIVSHVGYKMYRLWLEEPAGPFTILLEPSYTLLQEVEIKGITEPQPFFKEDKYAVLDYEVDRDLVYLLIYRFRLSKAELLCMSIYGDTVAPPLKLHFKPASLFYDCLGYVHVLTKDSAYQVTLGRDSLYLSYVYDIEKYNSTLKDCVASTDDFLFFRRESRDHLTIDFFKIDRRTKQRQHFTTSADMEKLKILYDNPGDYYYLVSNRIPDGRENLVNYVWIKKILYKPNVTVMSKIKNTLCLFNTTDGTLSFYNLDGLFLNKVEIPIEDKGEGLWTKEIYIDQAAGLAYTSFLKGGVMTVFRIDLTTGDLERVNRTAHIFPQMVKVHNHHLYYLYDVPGESDNLHLMKQKM
jgi:hypothetical protein